MRIYENQGATYAIPEGARRFSAAVGNDDNQPFPDGSAKPLTYAVFLDGRRVAVAHVPGENHDPDIVVDVAGGSSLELRISTH